MKKVIHKKIAKKKKKKKKEKVKIEEKGEYKFLTKERKARLIIAILLRHNFQSKPKFQPPHFSSVAGTHRIQILTPNPICLLCTLSPPPFSAKLPNNNVPNFFGSRIYGHQISTPLLSRRLVLASVSGLFDALTGGGSARDAVAAVRRGMLLFRQGDVQGSLLEFDKAIDLDPRQKAYLWQRGLSLYYLDRFEEGAEQFRLDVAQNPNDTEESIWCFLCEAQLYGVDEARRRFLEVGVDPRPVMRESYRMFKDGGDPEKLVAAFSSGGQSEYFYASLYAGLYYESERKSNEAKHHLIASCKSPYGSRSEDYMASLAKVHCACRNWTFS